jgi:predicted transcriptional regulator
MNDIKLDTVGKIVKGDQQGWYILIEHDPDDTGGYYIFQAPNEKVKESKEGYDDWLEKFEDITAYFTESSWIIEWIYPVNNK